MPKRRWNIDGGSLGMLCAVLLAGHGPLRSQQMSVPAAQDSVRTTLRPSLLEVHLNGVNLHQTALLLTAPDGRMLAASKDLTRWHLRIPDVAGIDYQDQTYLPLDALDPLHYRVDAATQSLSIEAPAGNFLPSTLDALAAPPLLPQMPAPGGFINYDLAAQRLQDKGSIGAQLELGVFAGGALATTGMLHRDLGTGKRAIRLDSTVTMDHPGTMDSLRLGDAISRGGAWGRSLRFGGLQWGTNFATQADLVTFPLPSLSGSAALPSTAELFVNDVSAYQQALPAGPFSIRQLPVITGQGEVRMVVRDTLGREQVITQPYYAVRNLLRPGLSDFSYEIGALRRNFSSVSNDYRQWLLGATRRHGVSARLTSEVHAELRPGRQAFGFAATMLWQQAGVFDAALARSHGALGGGTLLALGFERQGPGLSFGLRTELASQRFEQAESGLGAALTPGPLQQSTLHAGWNTAQGGSLGLAYLRLAYRAQPDGQSVSTVHNNVLSSVLSASYQRTLARGWHAGLSAFRMQQSQGQAQHHYALALVLTHALDQRKTASLSAGNQPASALLQLQQNLPAGSGIGYRLLAGSAAGARVEAGVNLQTDVGNYTAEAARQAGGDAYRATASGALAVLGGQASLARRLGDSFAVVRVPGYAGVRVYAENQPVARTDAAGTALISGLRPYQQNRLGIEQGDLPLAASVGALDIIAIPYFRSGVDVVFPVEQSNGALLRLTIGDGSSVPAGALATIGAATFPVALGGQVYLSGLKPDNHVEVTWDGQRCAFDLAYPASAHQHTPLPDLGSVPCQPSQP